MAQAAKKKRPREKPTVDSERAAIFEDLAHESEEIRIKAATKLLARLEKSDANDEVQYSLRRLFRGLCSSRKAARLGFSVALTETLSQHARSDARSILALWLDLTQTSGQMEGQEVRDHVMGRVFGAEAIVQSGILFEDRSNQTFWKDLLTHLFALANRKVWIREECGWVALLGIRRVKSDGLGEEWASAVLDLLKEHKLARTSEGTALWIIAEKSFPALTKPSGVFDDGDPLASRNRAALVKILREETGAASEEDGKQTQRSTWSARPHFAWDIIFSTVPENRFRDFWREVVDEGLFSKSSSNERKHWGLSLFSQQVATLPAERITDIFRTNLCRCLANQFAAKDRYLHSAATSCVASILDRAQVAPSVVGHILVRLTEDDLRTLFAQGQLRTKLLDKIATFADASSVQTLAKTLQSSDKETDRQAITRRASRLDLLVAILKSKPYPTDEGEDLDAVRVECERIIQLLVSEAYSGPSNLKGGEESDRRKDKSRSQLWTCLVALSLKERLPAYHPQTAVEYLQSLEEGASRSLLTDAKVRKSVSKACGIITKLGERGQQITSSHDALRLLLCLCVIQVYNGEADALEALGDLRNCYEDIRSTGDDEGQARASITIIELLLSFASKTSTLFKNIAQRAFSLCLDIVNEDCVTSMIQVLETQESLAGQNEMFENQDEVFDEGDNEVGSGESSDQEQDSDVEMIDGDEQNGNAADDSSDDDDDDDDDDEGNEDDPSDGEEKDDELEAFDAKLAEALGTRRADQDLAHGDEESSDSDMDDDQMEALDEHLSSMFRQRKQAESKSKKKEQKDAKENVTVFKSRVLDLIKVFVDQRHQSDLALEFVLPLLNLIRSTQNKPLANKAANLVKDYMKHIKLVVHIEDESKDQTDAKPRQKSMKRSKRLLKDVHATALQQGSNMFQSACSQASLLLVKVFLSNGGSIQDAIKIYGSTQAVFWSDKNCGLKTAFFTDWMNWCTSTRQQKSE